MNPYTNGELNAFPLLQTSIEVSHRSKNSQTSSYCSLGIIFVCLGIAEIDKQTVTEQLSDMPIVALNNCRTHLLIRTNHFSVLFGIKLAGKFRGINQVTKQQAELPSFRVRRRRCR